MIIFLKVSALRLALIVASTHGRNLSNFNAGTLRVSNIQKHPFVSHGHELSLQTEAAQSPVAGRSRTQSCRSAVSPSDYLREKVKSCHLKRHLHSDGKR